MSRKTLLWSMPFLGLLVVWGGRVLLSSVPAPPLPPAHPTRQHTVGQTAESVPGTPRALPERLPAAAEPQPAVRDAASAPDAAPTAPPATSAVRSTPNGRKRERGRRGQEVASAAVPPRPGTGQSIVEVKHQRVRLQVQNTALHTVLRALAAHTGITVTDRANTSTTLLTLTVENVPVEDALHRLLAGFDVVFVYRGRADAVGELAAVWIYPRGQGLQVAPGGDDDSAILEALHHADPTARAQAYESLLARPDWLTPEVVLDGLQDTEAQVRFRVLSQAAVANVVLPADSVERLALTDPEPHVRLAALATLLFHPDVDPHGVERIALAASADPDPEVQSKALELLAHLEAMQIPEVMAALQLHESEAAISDLGEPVHPTDAK